MALIDDVTARKYGIETDGLARYYKLVVGERLFDLEHTSPHAFSIGDQVFVPSSWSDLLLSVSKYLFDIFPEKIVEAESFKTDWSAASIFFPEEKVNSMEVGFGLFININHTAVHSCWLLYDLLAWFGISFSSCELIVHRAPKAEPEEVRHVVAEHFINGFTDFLKWKKLVNPANIPLIMKNINYLETKYLQIRGARSGYDSLFLFDDTRMFGSMKAKFLSDLRHGIFFGKEKQLATIKKCLDYLTEYYGSLT